MSQSPYDKPPASPFGKPIAKPDHKGGSQTSGKATASLILGISSIVGMCFTGIIGVVLGILALSDISKSRGRVQGKGMAVTGIVLSSLGIVWTLMVMTLMLLPAVQQVREAARRTASQNNIRQQIIGMHNYVSVNQSFPQLDKSGLSWRVHLLPYLGENELYEQFRLDEPWDSSHNIQLLDQMPRVYDSLSANLPPGMTLYQVPYTDVNDPSYQNVSALFDTSGDNVSFKDILDGASNTIAIIEVDQQAAVEWTRPSDWKFDPGDPMHDLGGFRRGQILVGMADGMTLLLSDKIDSESFKAMITRSGGEIVSVPF